MTKEFIKSVRDIQNGEWFPVYKVLEWLAETEHSFQFKFSRGELAYLKDFHARIKSVLNDLFDNDIEDVSKIINFYKIESYYSLKDVRDWKIAFDESTEDDTKVSYWTYTNLKKYNVEFRVKEWYLNRYAIIEYRCEGKVFNALSDFSTRRTKAAPMRALSFLVDDQYPNSKERQEVIDKISYLFNRSVQNGTFDIVTGNELLACYLEENYNRPSNTSTLWNSCMRHESHQESLTFYADNPEVVKLAVLRLNDKVLARTLCWFTNDSYKYYDRIYGYDSYAENALRDWLEKEGFRFVGHSRVRVEIDHWNQSIPYIDNMCYFTSNGIQNYEGSRVICGPYQTTSGLHFEYNDDYVEVGDRYFDREDNDLVYSDYLGEYLLDAEATRAYYSRNHRDYFPQDDCTYSDNYEAEIYLYADGLRQTHDRDYAFEDDVDYDYKGNLYHTDSLCYSETLEISIYEGDAVKPDNIYDWFPKEYCELINGKYYYKTNETVEA